MPNKGALTALGVAGAVEKPSILPGALLRVKLSSNPGPAASAASPFAENR